MTIGAETAAQTADNAPTIEQLQKDMYRYFGTTDVERFTQAVEQLKEAALKAGNEKLFYKAWANQASFAFTRLGRQKGIDLCNEMRTYAEQHDSKYGLYTSTFANAGMLTHLKQYILAEKEYLNCIEFLKNYFPDESAAAIYLALAKIAQNNDNVEKVRDYANKVLADTKASPIHKLNAASYKCLSYSTLDSNFKDEFNRAYEERQKLKAELGQEGFFGTTIDFEHALKNELYDTAWVVIKRMSPLEQRHMTSRLYEKMGQYKEALLWYKRYRIYGDSINISSERRQVTEYAAELGVARAESEAKDLRLANQALRLKQAEQELRQRQLETEAAALELKNRDAELANAAMQLEHATLDGEAKEWQYRQRLAEMEAQKNAEAARRLSQTYIFVIIAIVLVALAFFTYRRIKQVRKLKAVNDELRTAYQQLEQTTTVKNRIESELRIARDIQMTMVPEVFPDRANLDMQAYIQPAKEVGGDLYTFLLVDRPDDEDGSEALLYFCIGDVSGKGIPASLFMAQTTRLFRSMAAQGLMPAEIADRMNRELSDHNEQGMFVTMFIGLANLQTGHLDFCNCGHNPPVLNGEFLNVESNAPLALWPEMDFVGEEIADIRGQRLLLYTDGLNEAEDGWQNQFGDDHLLQLLQQHPDDDAQQTIDMLREAVAEHVGDAEPSDDLTMLCMKIRK